MPHALRRSALLLATMATLPLATATHAQGPSIDAFFERFTADWVRLNPNQAIATRYFTGPEQETLEREITPFTADWRRRRVEIARRGLAELAGFDRARLSRDQRLSADLMQWQLEIVVEAEQYQDFYFPLEQFGGANVSLPNLLTVVHPIVTERDAENYVARLAQVATRMDEAVAEAAALGAKRLLPPRFIIAATIAQMEQFVSTAPAQNPFVSVFAERTMAAALPQPVRQRLTAEAEQVTALRVYPAWRRALALLRRLQVDAGDAAGLSRFPGGAEAYAFALRAFTSTPLTADEIHDIGLREVARLEAEMDAVLRRLGRTHGSIAARTSQLAGELAYPDSEAGRAALVADLERMIRDAEARATALFDITPRAPVVVRPYPEFRQAAAAASYTVPARDGSRPGVFQIPLRASYLTKFGKRTLVYHETIPGHHFQLALELENETTPRFRRIRAFGGIPALIEGWALYAERLAAEEGWYESDPEGLLGQLDAALFRARRLVVDTGLHAKGWSRQQAIDYGIEASEVERYVVNPGQACAYMIGQMKLVELREKARVALGNRFSARSFHDAVLAAGTVPLTLLEQVVDRFIEAGR